MRIRFTICILLLALAQVTHAQTRTLRVFIFAGQSNAIGAGSTVADFNQYDTAANLNQWDSHNLFTYKLLQNMQGPNNPNGNDPNDPDKWIVSDGIETMDDLPVGPLNGSSNALFGSEIQFARETKQDLVDQGLTDDVAIIKVAAGSSKISRWIYHDPKLFYDHLLDHVDKSMMWFDTLPQYDEIRIRGFVWLQGESDVWGAVGNEDPNFHYYYGLCFNKMLRDLRLEYNEPQLPFVISVIKGRKKLSTETTAQWNNYVANLVITRKMQKLLADNDRFGHPLFCETATLTDNVHWDYHSHHWFGKIIAHKIKWAGILGENVGGDPHSHVENDIKNQWIADLAAWRQEIEGWVGHPNQEAEIAKVMAKALEQYHFRKWYSDYIKISQVNELDDNL